MHPKMFMAGRIGQPFNLVTKRGVISYNPVHANPETAPRRAKGRYHRGIAGYDKGFGATFFVGLTSGYGPREEWTAEDVREFVLRIRNEQLAEMWRVRFGQARGKEKAKLEKDFEKWGGHGASFIPQLGYWCKLDEEDCTENSVSIRILDLDEGMARDDLGRPTGEFVENMYDLAMQLREHYRQWAVVLQIDHGGVLQKTFILEP
jgi:hypothetical protein